MIQTELLVLDNTVLSAFYKTEWFHGFEFWYPDYRIGVSNLIWESEFKPYHDIDENPDWLEVLSADLEQIHSPAIGQLSRADWSCIALAEQHDEARIITNDSTLRCTAKDRELSVEWGTRFAIRTFKECGITETEFEEHLEQYITDVTLPPSVAEELRTTKKSE